VVQPRPARARPRRRGRRPTTYQAVLAAVTRLLETVPLSQLSVAQILAAAGVGRTSFYEHFTSKEDVVVKLVRSVSAEMAHEIEPMFSRGEGSPDEGFREGLTRLIRMSDRYAPLILTATEEWPAVPELRRLWFRMHADLTARIAAIIVQDRAAGLAPPGADAQALAAGLVWSTERALHIAKTGLVPALPDHEAIVAPLVQLYVQTIYGRPPQLAA
jgi:TetR/AcrR family transcriptional regulator, ethionamide resistance regulator